MSVILRPYQQEALDIIKNIQPKGTSLIALPTATGKTLIFAALSAQTSGRVLIVVPSTELRIQAINKLKDTDSILDVGSVQASLNEVENKVIVSTRQSLTHIKSTRIEQMLNNGEFEYVIFDEAHQAPNQLIKIINKLNSNAKILGFTATPYNKECIDIFGEPAYRKSIYEMIMTDFLCEPIAFQISTKTNLNDVKIIAGEFNQKQLENAVNNNERNRILIESYKKYASDRKSTLVFASGIAHSNDLAQEFTDNGIYCKSIDSTLSDEERNNILEEFKSGKLPVIVNCMILTVGFDHPPIDCLILARPTKSRILYEQILGRGLRLFNNKENCLIIDVQDIIRNHDLMDISSVFNMNIKSGETTRSAECRILKEHEENEKQKLEEEIKRKEREKKQLEELELIAKQIKLFNRDMALRFNEAYHDWFRVDNFTYGVSEDSNNHFVIENDNDDFYVYWICTDKNNKNIECLNSNNSLLESIDYVENYCFKRLTSFVYRDAKWKTEPATEKQKQYVKWAKYKWQVHCYFTSNSIKWQLKKYKEENY
jgi:superfamily II DNA or RNA helicase